MNDDARTALAGRLAPLLRKPDLFLARRIAEARVNAFVSATVARRAAVCCDFEARGLLRLIRRAQDWRRGS